MSLLLHVRASTDYLFVKNESIQSNLGIREDVTLNFESSGCEQLTDSRKTTDTLYTITYYGSSLDVSVYTHLTFTVRGTEIAGLIMLAIKGQEATQLHSIKSLVESLPLEVQNKLLKTELKIIDTRLETCRAARNPNEFEGSNQWTGVFMESVDVLSVYGLPTSHDSLLHVKPVNQLKDMHVRELMLHNGETYTTEPLEVEFVEATYKEGASTKEAILTLNLKSSERTERATLKFTVSVYDVLYTPSLVRRLQSIHKEVVEQLESGHILTIETLVKRLVLVGFVTTVQLERKEG